MYNNNSYNFTQLSKTLKTPFGDILVDSKTNSFIITRILRQKEWYSNFFVQSVIDEIKLSNMNTLKINELGADNLDSIPSNIKYFYVGLRTNVSYSYSNYVIDFDDLHDFNMLDNLLLSINDDNKIFCSKNSTSTHQDFFTKTFLLAKLPTININLLPKIIFTKYPNSLEILFLKSNLIGKLPDTPHTLDTSDINFNTNFNTNFNANFNTNLKQIFIISDNFEEIPNMKGLYALLLLWIKSEKFNGTLDNLSTKLNFLYINSISFNQSVSNLPSTLKVLSILSNVFNQELNNLPSGLKILQIYSENFTQSLDYLPETMEFLYFDFGSNNTKYVNLEVHIKRKEGFNPEINKNFALSEKLFNLPSGVKKCYINDTIVLNKLENKLENKLKNARKNTNLENRIMASMYA